MNFQHFIITRFNVNIDRHQSPNRLNDTWLAARFDLFQRYCFPTVSAQSEQNFRWLVLFDEQTPSRYLRLIKAYEKYPNFVPVYCGDHPIMPGVLERMKQLAPDAEWLVTTRLDNDDALSVNFVKCLHGVVQALDMKALESAGAHYINFPNGLQLHQEDFYDFRDVTNAFVTLVERAAKPHGVFWIDHPGIYEKAPVIQAETSPLWLQVLHEINLYNYLRGEKIEGADFRREFPCNYE